MMKKAMAKKAMPAKKMMAAKSMPTKSMPAMPMMKKGGMAKKYGMGGALQPPKIGSAMGALIGGAMGINPKDSMMKKTSSQPKTYGSPAGKDYKDTIKKPTMRKGGKATMRKGGKSC